MGRKQGWGRREYGRKEYGALGTPRHTILHLHPQATTFLSPPGGIYLIKGPKGPEPALVSLISLTMVVVVVTAAAVGSSEALRGHLDSRRGVPLSGLFEGDATRT